MESDDAQSRLSAGPKKKEPYKNAKRVIKGVKRVSDNFDTWGTIVSIFTFTAIYKVTYSSLINTLPPADAFGAWGLALLAIGISAVVATFVIYASTQYVIKYFIKKTTIRAGKRR